MQDWLQKFPSPWAEMEGIGLTSHQLPVDVEIKSGADPVRVSQFPMPLKARREITPHVRQLLEREILRPIQPA